jgi:hypothetical protein
MRTEGHDSASADFLIGQREIIRRISMGGRVPKGIEEKFSSSGLGKRRSRWEWTCPRWCVCVRVVSKRENLFAFCSREEEKNFTMPPRRERKSPDPEDRGNLRGRGRQAQNPEMERKIRDLRGRLEDMEAAQRCTASAGDLSDSEGEVEVEQEGEVAVEYATNERLIKAITRMSSNTKMDILAYEGNLDAEELLDWIRALDTYFDYEDIEEDKKVRHVVTQLKGHATLWWDELQEDRRSKGKQNIKIWDRMIAKMKENIIPRDYQITLFRRMQNLRQKLMTVKEYTEKFYKLNIRVGHRESDDEKVVRYMNGLRYDI